MLLFVTKTSTGKKKEWSCAGAKFTFGRFCIWAWTDILWNVKLPDQLTFLSI